jgi:hypothetical protein
MNKTWKELYEEMAEKNLVLQERLGDAVADGGGAGGADSETREAEFARVQAYAKEHNLSLGAAYEVLGKPRSVLMVADGAAARPEGDEGEDALEKEVRAYAAEHKCSIGAAYEAIGARRARAGRESSE